MQRLRHRHGYGAEPGIHIRFHQSRLTLIFHGSLIPRALHRVKISIRSPVSPITVLPLYVSVCSRDLVINRRLYHLCIRCHIIHYFIMAHAFLQQLLRCERLLIYYDLLGIYVGTELLPCPQRCRLALGDDAILGGAVHLKIISGNKHNKEYYYERAAHNIHFTVFIQYFFVGNVIFFHM